MSKTTLGGTSRGISPAYPPGSEKGVFTNFLNTILKVILKVIWDIKKHGFWRLILSKILDDFWFWEFQKTSFYKEETSILDLFWPSCLDPSLGSKTLKKRAKITQKDDFLIGF